METTAVKEISILKDGHVTSPIGFYAGGVHCGLRRKKLDFGWIYSDTPANAAGVYTQNTFQAAPLLVTKHTIEHSKQLQSIIVNSANANSFTSKQGYEDALLMQKLAANQLNIEQHHVAVASTGIIGERLPMGKIRNGIKQISPTQVDAKSFEKSILTTDTTTKHVAVQLEIDGKQVTIGGAAKGSGMIHPNMATMLSFITTDANVNQNSLQQALRSITDQSYNQITVDGDSSTNDMVLILANGRAENKELNENHPDWSVFKDAWNIVAIELAKMIARDGEGATKLIEVVAKGASTIQQASQIAKAVISSNLVKTAIYGNDANWGRIIGAIGYSGVPVDASKLSIAIGGIEVVNNGEPIVFDEKDCKHALNQERVNIVIDLQNGMHTATAWGCDLTYEYIKINASYRT
ncbi:MULTISPECIES: bifunctional ornithine acetyltransferase/N-acetylglutamate synthase [unclassified Oceanobacillus]|uniref:bifunctional ornithine acetyltransferase/N-acetylglutamate synthase n=1 Tax=unclassified Oceanobacillus TaxID=2630292 RepID=UPI001BE9F715|nr:MULTISPECIES: bifunctional ornithine acetyltransferase/N-acetylglutamate synthase [unclassified Oceanobacillus]MBT2599213.1 bifunctional ornithine acetyltransferase/N-acetylglutamate synthase [Oceanobacillus sp. ISL-74]MBT2652131.1 bifunctional ornithine acetyltransferase/N-acetylglutamate synthase [Oceanobacillus sp. ISL-73]